MSFTYILPVAVPDATVANDLPTLHTHPAWSSNLNHITADESLWPSLWKMNQAVAIAYGLDAADLAYILGTFPVFKRKRAAFAAWLEARVAEWAAS